MQQNISKKIIITGSSIFLILVLGVLYYSYKKNHNNQEKGAEAAVVARTYTDMKQFQKENPEMYRLFTEQTMGSLK